MIRGSVVQNEVRERRQIDFVFLAFFHKGGLTLSATKYGKRPSKERLAPLKRKKKSICRRSLMSYMTDLYFTSFIVGVFGIMIGHVSGYNTSHVLPGLIIGQDFVHSLSPRQQYRLQTQDHAIH